MFDNFMVFKDKEENAESNRDLPHILSYNHDSWTGYLRSQNDRKEDDDFITRLKSISRG